MEFCIPLSTFLKCVKKYQLRLIKQLLSILASQGFNFWYILKILVSFRFRINNLFSLHLLNPHSIHYKRRLNTHSFIEAQHCHYNICKLIMIIVFNHSTIFNTHIITLYLLILFSSRKMLFSSLAFEQKAKNSCKLPQSLRKLFCFHINT